MPKSPVLDLLVCDDAPIPEDVVVEAESDFWDVVAAAFFSFKALSCLLCADFCALTWSFHFLMIRLTRSATLPSAWDLYLLTAIPSFVS